MKKVLIPVFVFLALAIASAVYFISLRINYTAYENRLVTAAAYLDESGAETVADYGGRRTAVDPANLPRLFAWLAPDSREAVYTPLPDAEDGLSITISFGDRYRITAVQPLPDKADDDTCYIELSDADGGNVYRCKTHGLRTMYWLAATTGPEGIYAPNKALP